MIGSARLGNLQYCLETVLEDGVPRDFIETGVWRGGVCIFARAVFQADGYTGGQVWVADSFSGLPPPCAQAIHDVRNASGIVDPIVDIDGIGAFWRRGW